MIFFLSLTWQKIQSFAFAPRKPYDVMLVGFCIFVLPLILAFQILRLWEYDLSIPFFYNGGDIIWQLTLSKMMTDTGWILTSPFMGAPEIAKWHNNAAAQTSAIHSVAIWIINKFVEDSVAAQQIWYLLNFPLITFSAFISCRLLKISRSFSVCVGLIYAFIGFRYNAAVYSFLCNFFIVPLSIVPAIWVITGKMLPNDFFIRGPKPFIIEIKDMLTSRSFLISLIIILLTAFTDGYYAFFTILFLGFAFLVRFVRGDILRPISLLLPMLLICFLLGTVLVITAPLRAYEAGHPEEFRPNDVIDSSLIKHPFEAEVYSVSIKMMLAPPATHQIEALALMGTKMLETANEVRKFPAMVLAPLGTLGSVLFLFMLLFIPISIINFNIYDKFGASIRKNNPEYWNNLGAIIGLALVASLSAISGGLGTIVALVYPTIRAYDRITLYLSFLLFAGAAILLNIFVRNAGLNKKRSLLIILPIITVLSILDQMPVGAYKRDLSIEGQFRAEQKFIQSMEAALPPDAMVYQFPHSQYLINNHYYGWGEFLHVRAYQHSKKLRWSNGAAKNSWVDNWHLKKAKLPILELASEMRSVGFRAFIVDRRVVKGDEYAQIRDAMNAYVGQQAVEDDIANFAWWPLEDPGFIIRYDPQYEKIKSIEVNKVPVATEMLFPSIIRRKLLIQKLATMPSDKPLLITREENPDIFRNADEFENAILERERVPLGLPIDFGTSSMGKKYLTRGWMPQEGWGAWTATKNSPGIITLPIAIDQLPSSVQLEFWGQLGPTLEKQEFFIRLTGSEDKKFIVTKEKPVVIEVIQFSESEKLEISETGLVQLEFRAPQGKSPKEMGLNNDERVLGFGIRKITLLP